MRSALWGSAAGEPAASEKMRKAGGIGDFIGQGWEEMDWGGGGDYAR